MRKQPIFRRILFPTILVLLLLPPISCLVFQYFAERNAYAEAARDLEALQQSILPLMSSSFTTPSSSEIVSDDLDDPEEVNASAVSDLEAESNRTEAAAPGVSSSNQVSPGMSGSGTPRPSTSGSGTLRPGVGETGTFRPRPNDWAATRPGTLRPSTGKPEAPSSESEETVISESATGTPDTSAPTDSNVSAEDARSSVSDTISTQSPVTVISMLSSRTTGAAHTISLGTDQTQSQITMIPGTSATKETENTVQTGTPKSHQTQVTAFLRKVSALIQSRGGNADVLILESHLAAVYPRDELAREALAPLTAVCTEYIQSNTAALGESRTAELQTETGEPYLVAFYEIPTPLPQLQYLITYCPIAQINSWVQNAARLVFLISAAFVLLALISLSFAARSIAQPLHRLCREAERIGGGNFVDIEPDFSLRELEELRGSMNQMSDQLMRADEIQRSFFQNVSHELRNPLMSISGYAQGIEQGIFRSSKEAAHTILEESVRLTELVNSLLTLSRMESDQQKSMLGSLPVADPIEDSLDRLNGLALQKGISLVLTPFDRGVTACAEEDLLGKVLDNLLTNAIRYAKTAVTVSVLSKDGQVAISVADDGDGIAEKDLPHLFERCYKGKGGNFGIGLAIARSAAQKMEGELTAANQINSGAVFTLTLKCS